MVTLCITGVEQSCTNKDVSDVFVTNGKISEIIRVPDEPRHQLYMFRQNRLF